jgi:hypothetical protein
VLCKSLDKIGSSKKIQFPGANLVPLRRKNPVNLKVDGIVREHLG